MSWYLDLDTICFAVWICRHDVNSLAPGRPRCHFKTAFFILVLLIGIFTSSKDNAPRWMPRDLTDDKSTLVQVMAWCCQVTSHYLNQCWPRSPTPYGVTRPQWVNLSMYDISCYLIILLLFVLGHWWHQHCRRLFQELVPHFTIKTVFPAMDISVLKIRWSRDCLIFIMGIPTLVRWFILRQPQLIWKYLYTGIYFLPCHKTYLA